MPYTVKEIADCLEVERPVAEALLAVMKALKLVKQRGVRSNQSGYGRPGNLYHFEMDFSDKLKRKLDESGMSGDV